MTTTGQQDAEQRRGVLYPGALPRFDRVVPAGALTHLVRWFWISRWDLPEGSVSPQHLIAFPATNLVVQHDRVELAGPSTRAATRELAGRGWGVGALLRPAAVPTVSPVPRSTVDRSTDLAEPDLQQRVRLGVEGDDLDAAVGAFGDWLLERVPEPSAEALLANRLAARIDEDQELLSLEALADGLAVSVRTLHRLTERYVGLSPAAMIRRRRLQVAADRLRQEPSRPVAEIATELGYADQAHLTRDFRAQIGMTPRGYRASLG